MSISTGKELAAACRQAAQNYKTIYVMGCFGAPMTPQNKERWISSQEYNRREDRKAVIESADVNTFGFDCVCFVKGLLWGWRGNPDKIYGGSEYQSNGVPDIDISMMLSRCTDVTSIFSEIDIGELLWLPGHVGIYLGDGLAAECTPEWEDGVQISAVENIGQQAGFPCRRWDKHGKLPYVSYDAEKDENAAQKPPESSSEEVILKETANVLLPWLHEEDCSESVGVMKRMLFIHGYSCGISNKFTTATANALSLFQLEHNIQECGCGKETWSRLLGLKA